MDECGVRDHADLDGIGRNIGKDGVKLRREEGGRHGKDICNAHRILRGECRDGAHAVDAVRRHGLEVCLNPRSAAGVAARNGQCRMHFHHSPLLIRS